MDEYTFIAVNHKNFVFTEKYIESINKIIINEEKINIIIIDNSLGLQDFELLETKFKNMENITIIHTENEGYFAGLNVGIKLAIEKNRKNIVIGNNDITFDKNFINEYKKIKYENKVMVIAPNIITKEGRMQNPHVINSVSKMEKLKSDIYFSNYYIGQGLKIINKFFKKNKKTKCLINNYPEMQIKRGIGACYILTENFFGKYEKLDDRVFMWGEEALLSNQVECCGGTTLYNPNIKITHHESASVAIIESKKKYYMIKKSYKIYRKYL